MSLKIKIISIIFFCLFNSEKIIAQSLLKGNVYSAKDSTALFGASVYFDGTSLGVSTNEKGEFRIPLKNATTSPLVVSSIGFETILIKEYDPQNDINFKIYLEESTESLPAVHLETDPWSREKKMKVFKREFLGTSLASQKCSIKNTEAISLTYIPSKELLIAEAKEPLKIINRHLGYEVTYTLTDFKVEFSTGASGIQFTTQVYFEGLSFFEELRESPSKRSRRNRKSAFLGSALHFMRSLAERTLTENNYRIFKKGFEVEPYKHFQLKDENELVQIQIIEAPITILYREVEQSSLRTENIFYIDALGNHTPPYSLMLSGHMAKKRAAEMLPLNYQPKK